MSDKKTTKIFLRVPVKIVYDNEKARRNVLAEVKRSLYVEYSTAGIDGWAVAETGRVTLEEKK